MAGRSWLRQRSGFSRPGSARPRWLESGGAGSAGARTLSPRAGGRAEAAGPRLAPCCLPALPALLPPLCPLCGCRGQVVVVVGSWRCHRGLAGLPGVGSPGEILGRCGVVQCQSLPGSTGRLSVTTRLESQGGDGAGQLRKGIFSCCKRFIFYSPHPPPPHHWALDPTSLPPSCLLLTSLLCKQRAYLLQCCLPSSP